MTDNANLINAQYSRGDLRKQILEALTKAGKKIDALTREDISAFDEFHVGGRLATRLLAERVGLKGEYILDVGSGIGGPARTLAAEFGCRVTGIDMTSEFCLTAEMLTERVGMSDVVNFKQGSATEMPFDNAQFDMVWMQHVGMNISDKQRLYAEIRRVLKPSGRFVFHEILANNEEPLHFPVPWADTALLSHLITEEAIRKYMAELGFVESFWEDVTERSMKWSRERKLKMETEGIPPLSIGLLLGKDVITYTTNMLRNLEEKRTMIIQACYHL
jgi:ubiquinone/menaquinone biosynthesis C-methylase UbiE